MKKVATITTCTFLCIALGAGVVFYSLHQEFTNSEKKHYVYIDTDDTIDSIYSKVDTLTTAYPMLVFKQLVSMMHYQDKIRTGRYAITPGMSVLRTLRTLRFGAQEPVMLSVPSVRLMGRLAKELSRQLMADSAQIATVLSTPATIIPNTYQVFWNIEPEALGQRMEKEYKAFWNDERTKKAEALGLSKDEVATLASIVDEETSNNTEKPMIAGLYYNRLGKGMLLQADPTVKYALYDKPSPKVPNPFALRRIYKWMLDTPSPYNTYYAKGLPPSPIRIPSVAGIDAVLNLVHHNYLYMCANDDFSGTHCFASTYAEHTRNAARYVAALKERGIK